MHCDWCDAVSSKLFQVAITAGAVEKRISLVCPACSLHFPLVGSGRGLASVPIGNTR